MKTNQNIGTLNAFIRITLGLTLLCWSATKLIKRPWRQSYLLIVFLSAMKIAEGMVKFCPLTEVIKQCQGETRNKSVDESAFQEPVLPYSPL